MARVDGAVTVTNLNDSGDGSLRAAVAATPPGGVVDFAPGLTGTITLTSKIDVNGLTISGPGASVLRISGGHTTRQLRWRYRPAAGATDMQPGILSRDVPCSYVGTLGASRRSTAGTRA